MLPQLAAHIIETQAKQDLKQLKALATSASLNALLKLDGSNRKVVCYTKPVSY
jgi:hypothetical protein